MRPYYANPAPPTPLPLEGSKGNRRRGFTLIEMMVVISILLVVTTLAVAFIPRAGERQRVTFGASQLQGWLLVARQWAQRDQAPRGLRILYSGNIATQVQYIEQPEEYLGGRMSYDPSTAMATGTIDFSGQVQAGDYLMFPNASGVGGPFRVTGVSGSSLSVTGPTAAAIPSTSNYRLMRQARVKVGESVLELPQNIIVDWNKNKTYDLYTDDLGNLDIMFSPSGQVMNWTRATDKIHLWVRDSVVDDTLDKNELITVFIRTGMIAGHAVDPSDPYSFTRDGGPSGI